MKPDPSRCQFWVSMNDTFFTRLSSATALTFTQPITPLFMVNQAVKIARADEHIATAKLVFRLRGNSVRQR
jgi:hypothetical protein